MGITLVTNHHGKTVLTCNTADWAFGPVFDNADDAVLFLAWFERGSANAVASVLGCKPIAGLPGTDPRDWPLGPLASLYSTWLSVTELEAEITEGAHRDF